MHGIHVVVDTKWDVFCQVHREARPVGEPATVIEGLVSRELRLRSLRARRRPGAGRYSSSEEAWLSDSLIQIAAGCGHQVGDSGELRNCVVVNRASWAVATRGGGTGSRGCCGRLAR